MPAVPFAYGLRVPIRRARVRDGGAHRARPANRCGYPFAGALTGSYADIAERLHAYAEIGITSFVIDAVPRSKKRIGSENTCCRASIAPVLERAG